MAHYWWIQSVIWVAAEVNRPEWLTKDKFAKDYHITRYRKLRKYMSSLTGTEPACIKEAQFEFFADLK